MQIIRNMSPTERKVYDVLLRANTVLVIDSIAEQVLRISGEWETNRRIYVNLKVPADVREEALRRVRESVRWEE